MYTIYSAPFNVYCFVLFLPSSIVFYSHIFLHQGRPKVLAVDGLVKIRDKGQL